MQNSANTLSPKTNSSGTNPIKIVTLLL
jgi:hypothetical protein